MSLESGYIPKSQSASAQRMEDNAGARSERAGGEGLCALLTQGPLQSCLEDAQSDLEMHSEQDGTTKRAPNQQALNT